ncbi:metallophosphoesterase family protein [Paenibacillus piri]|uniref:Metallophosphoesterase n=1 Tax=Paenibacillus piri TaxID=2547395 RepID=A0A4R5KBD7_9BACL|nr:metallophosphoesterase [Paenibacillus piri]TDF92346.1 metallophosphoesterase [Paenibacillus piri]
MRKTSIGSALLSLFLCLMFVLPTGADAQPEEKPLFGFSVLSDIHVEAWSGESQNKFANALADLQQAAPDSLALILNGDLTNGLPGDYLTLNSLLKENPHPQSVFASIGNHEFYKSWFKGSGSWSSDTFPNGETEQASIQRFLQFTGESSVYYQKKIQGFPFIFLGSEQYRQSNPDNAENAYLSQTQLDWLRQSLLNAQYTYGLNRPIFVFLHQPLSDTVSGSECCINYRSVIQDKELRNILSAFPQVILFTSHSHMNLRLPKTFVQDLFTMVNTSSASDPWTSDSNGAYKPLGGNASEGLYVEVYPNSRVVIKGRDFANHAWIPEAQYTVLPPSARNPARSGG